MNQNQGWAFRTAYLPVVTSMVGVSIVLPGSSILIMGWSITFLASRLQVPLGLAVPMAMPVKTIIVSVWKTAGYHMVIYLAALQNVSPEL